MKYFQLDCFDWCSDTFGEDYAKCKMERADRFLEESLELAQACGMDRKRAMKILEMVFSKPVGDVSDEIGGTMTTLSVLCEAWDLDVFQCAWDQLEKIKSADAEKIKKKLCAKLRMLGKMGKLKEGESCGCCGSGFCCVCFKKIKNYKPQNHSCKHSLAERHNFI